MSPYESYRRKKWPKDKPSPHEESPSANLLYDVSRLLGEVRKIVTSDDFESSESSQRTEKIPAEADYVISESAERTESPDESGEETSQDLTTVPDPISQHEEDEAYLAGMMSFSYLKGLLEYKVLNFDDSIKHLTRCYELAVKTSSREYAARSQSQLAAVYLKRYEIYALDADYRLASLFLDNARRMGKDTRRLI
ncbi:MAG: hypothetical protein ACXADS_13970 [Candidatus Thorarchaeota archaeon]